MELTITQSGALYALQHRPLRRIRSAPKRQAIVIQTIRPITNLEWFADRKIKTEEVCFT